MILKDWPVSGPTGGIRRKSVGRVRFAPVPGRRPVRSRVRTGHPREKAVAASAPPVPNGRRPCSAGKAGGCRSALEITPAVRDVQANELRIR